MHHNFLLTDSRVSVVEDRARILAWLWRPFRVVFIQFHSWPTGSKRVHIYPLTWNNLKKLKHRKSQYSASGGQAGDPQERRRQVSSTIALVWYLERISRRKRWSNSAGSPGGPKQRKGATITALECTRAFQVCCASSAKYWWALKREEFPEAEEGNTPPHQNEIILEAHPKPGTLHTLAIRSGQLSNSQASGRYSRSGNNYFQTKGCSGLTWRSQPCENPTPSLMPEPALWPHPIPLEQETIPGTSLLVSCTCQCTGHGFHPWFRN